MVLLCVWQCCVSVVHLYSTHYYGVPLLCIADKRDVRAGNINREREVPKFGWPVQNLMDIFGNYCNK